MEISRIKELSELAQGQIQNSKEYSEARQKAGRAETDLKIILASKLNEFRTHKKNVGIEMAVLMLLEESEVARNLFKEWQEQEAKYKGLEKIIDATSSKLIYEQSVLKYIGQGEKWG